MKCFDRGVEPRDVLLVLLQQLLVLTPAGRVEGQMASGAKQFPELRIQPPALPTKVLPFLLECHAASNAGDPATLAHSHKPRLLGKTPRVVGV